MWHTTYFELHSQATRLQDAANHHRRNPNGAKTLYGKPLSKANLGKQQQQKTTPIRNTSTGKASRLCAGLIRVHSPLLAESLLVSFPPLTDMLKFSG